MSLSRLEGAFRSVTKPEELVEVYVPLKRFEVRDDPQAFVFGKLQAPEPARIALVGEPGAGKSGAVLSALDGLEQMEAHRFAAIHIKVGDPEVLGSASAFLQHVLQTMSAAADNLEDGPEAEELDRAAASSTTVNDPQQTVAGGLKVPVVSADVTLRRSFRSYEVPTGEASAAKHLGEVLDDLREAGHRVVFVIDDTEKFTANAEGELNREAVANLFAKALDGLCELPGEFDVVVAVQPVFRREVGVVDDYLDRLGFARQNIPPLPPHRTPPPLADLLARRLDVAGIATPLDEMVATEALTALDAIYRQLDHDLRKVLNLAGSAARLANVDPDASRLEARHVAHAQEEARRSS